jgi:transcriptional regulator with XRE-family HTH domain
LREARARIPVDSASLGDVLRIPRRIGKPVTQEEIVEVIGVSRVWYTTVERGRLNRPCVALLERICNALMLDERQRGEVFQLGIPEISSHLVELQHAAILQASAQLRTAAKRLWCASTVDEALTIAAEESTQHFDDVALVFFGHRIAAGKWEGRAVVDRGIGAQNTLFLEDLARALSPDRFDEIALYPMLSEPGQVGTLNSHNATSVAAEYSMGLAKYKLHRTAFIHARICSRGGVTAGISVKHASEHVYSEVGRAVISAIASLTSLALS